MKLIQENYKFNSENKSYNIKEIIELYKKGIEFSIFDEDNNDITKEILTRHVFSENDLLDFVIENLTEDDLDDIIYTGSLQYPLHVYMFTIVLAYTGCTMPVWYALWSCLLSSVPAVSVVFPLRSARLFPLTTQDFRLLHFERMATPSFFSVSPRLVDSSFSSQTKKQKKNPF